MLICDRNKMISSMAQVINHFPCNKAHLHQVIKYLRTVDSHDIFELKSFHSEDYPAISFELVVKGLETGLDIEPYFPIRTGATPESQNTHSCSIFFNQSYGIEQITFTLTSASREASFDVHFDNSFEFQWYEMYYLKPDRMFGSSNDCVNSLVDEMSYFAC